MSQDTDTMEDQENKEIKDVQSYFSALPKSMVFECKDISNKGRIINPEKNALKTYLTKTVNGNISGNYAVKIIKGDDNIIECLKTFVEFNKIKNPNVVCFFGAALQKVNGQFELSILSELADNNLVSALEKPGGAPRTAPHPAAVLPWDVIMDFVIQIAKGLACLHSQAVIHGNLKSSNILIFDKTKGHQQIQTLKLCDFGEKKNPETVPTVYTAPEKLLTLESDVYSFGVILFWFVTGKSPEEKDPKIGLINAIIPRQGCPEFLVDLCKRCLAQNPEDRPKNGVEISKFLEIKESVE